MHQQTVCKVLERFKRGKYLLAYVLIGELTHFILLKETCMKVIALHFVDRNMHEGYRTATKIMGLLKGDKYYLKRNWYKCCFFL